jgi:hypothetical protein
MDAWENEKITGLEGIGSLVMTFLRLPRSVLVAVLLVE